MKKKQYIAPLIQYIFIKDGLCQVPIDGTQGSDDPLAKPNHFWDDDGSEVGNSSPFEPAATPMDGYQGKFDTVKGKVWSD